MPEPESIDPGHASTRDLLRVVGPLVAIVGGLFMLVGIVDFFSAFGSVGSSGPFGSQTIAVGDSHITLTPDRGMGPPQHFWCLFVGMPMLGIGLMMCRAGFMGKIARYTSAEITPVVTDSLNYAARESKDSIREVAKAVRDGLAGGGAAEAAEFPCPRCLHKNEPGAKFCSQCGSALITSRACPKCRHENDLGAKFCDNCGEAMGG
jgi:hypothetical protein